MPRILPASVLVVLFAASAAAYAQLPAAGPLLPPEFAAEPAHVPGGRVGGSPEDWATCVAERPAPPPALPPGIDPRGVDPASPNPLLGLPWFVDRMEAAYTQWREWRGAGELVRASTIWRLARQPRFRWFGRFTRPLMKELRGFLDRVQCDQPGTVPQIAILRAESNQCGPGYLGGGVAEDARTRSWYREFASVIGSARVVIGFEVDSLGTIDCLAEHRREDRLALLRYGVDVLAAAERHDLSRGGSLRLGAGGEDREEAAQHRRAQGARLHAERDTPRLDGGEHQVRARGLPARGRQAVRRQHRLQRPGPGPLPPLDRPQPPPVAAVNVWCHPGLRGLGPEPTTLTAHPKVDAYLYIGRPGYSGGSCNGGPTPVGTWWPERALMYAHYATDWQSPPAGTRYGHYEHHTPSELGALPG